MKLSGLGRKEKGFISIQMIIISIIFLYMAFMLVGVTKKGTADIVKSKKSVECFYIADAGIEKALWSFNTAGVYGGENNTAFGEGRFSVAVSIPDAAFPNRYQVISTGVLNTGGSSVTKNIRGIIVRNPVAGVFDYAYFCGDPFAALNGYYTTNGDIRANQEMQVMWCSTVNGDIYAGTDVRLGCPCCPTKGIGAEPAHQHPFSERLDMPVLDISYYKQRAIATSGVLQDTRPSSGYTVNGSVTGNVYMKGTNGKPITINGTVVVDGDLILEGVIHGQGTIVAGRNIYLANNITYKDGPATWGLPGGTDWQARDAWVFNNKNKDLVCFAAKGNVVIGDYTQDEEYGYNGPEAWVGKLSDGGTRLWMVWTGNEDWGPDGLLYSGDEGCGDGVIDTDYEDLDMDGQGDLNYVFTGDPADENGRRHPIGIKDYQGTSDKFKTSAWFNLPGGVTNYHDIASNDGSHFDGIYYTNHLMVGRWTGASTGGLVTFNGSNIHRNQTWAGPWYTYGSMLLNYDWRIHSRYSSDPNRFINIGLPVQRLPVGSVPSFYLTSWEEIN